MNLPRTRKKTKREIEPIGIVHYSGHWHMIAWCKLRNGYRDFRIDMIQTLKPTGATFDKRNLITLQEYFQSLMQTHQDMEKVTVLFDKAVTKYLKSTRYYYGFVSEEDLGERCRMVFLTGNMRAFCRWMLMYGTSVEIVGPEKLRSTMEEIVDEIFHHYKPALVSG